MKEEFKFLVVRKYGEAIQVTPIEDGYTTVQVNMEIPELNFSEVVKTSKQIYDDILTYYGGPGSSYALRKLAGIVENGKFFEEQEAKDLIGKFGPYSIDIEKKELEF